MRQPTTRWNLRTWRTWLSVPQKSQEWRARSRLMSSWQMSGFRKWSEHVCGGGGTPLAAFPFLLLMCIERHCMSAFQWLQHFQSCLLIQIFNTCFFFFLISFTSLLILLVFSKKHLQISVYFFLFFPFSKTCIMVLLLKICLVHFQLLGQTPVSKKSL